MNLWLRRAFAYDNDELRVLKADTDYSGTWYLYNILALLV